MPLAQTQLTQGLDLEVSEVTPTVRSAVKSVRSRARHRLELTPEPL